MYEMPKPDSLWRRKKDDRVDKVVGSDGSRYVLMYSEATGRHWHIGIAGFNKRYAPAEEDS